MSRDTCARCSGQRDGSHAAYCRACYNAYKREWHGRNRDREAQRKRRNPDAHRRHSRESMRRLRAQDPARAAEQFRRWREANPEKVALYDATKRAKRRAAIGGDRVTLDEWRAIKARYQHRCVYCGAKPRSLTMDHVVPLSRGGRHLADNIVPACRLCNGRKTNLSAIEFAQSKLGKLL